MTQKNLINQLWDLQGLLGNVLLGDRDAPAVGEMLRELHTTMGVVAGHPVEKVVELLQDPPVESPCKRGVPTSISDEQFVIEELRRASHYAMKPGRLFAAFFEDKLTSKVWSEGVNYSDPRFTAAANPDISNNVEIKTPVDHLADYWRTRRPPHPCALLEACTCPPCMMRKRMG